MKKDDGKFYWRIKGNFAQPYRNYLNYHEPSNRAAISEKGEMNNYRTRFTELEYMELATKFQFPVDMFEKVEE